MHFPSIQEAVDWNLKANVIVFDGNPFVREPRQVQLGCLPTHLLIITHRQMWAELGSVTFTSWQSRGKASLWSEKLAMSLFVVKLNLRRVSLVLMSVRTHTQARFLKPDNICAATEVTRQLNNLEVHFFQRKWRRNREMHCRLWRTLKILCQLVTDSLQGENNSNLKNDCC